MHSFLAGLLAASTLFTTTWGAAVQRRAGLKPDPKIAVYYGQGKDQLRLREFCNDDTVDIIPIGFVTALPNNPGSVDGYPTLDFGNQCGGAWKNEQGHATGMFQNCGQMIEDITKCQAKGKKILLSIGGESSVYFKNTQAGKDFATFMWGAFGPYSETWTGPRPFGKDIVLDGFDFDIETVQSNAPVPVDTGMAAAANQFRAIWGNNQRLLTAAPQCVVPDERFKNVLNQARFDAVFIQFYNTQRCSARAYFDKSFGDNISYDAWVLWLANNSKNPAIKAYIGLPASVDASSSAKYYLTPKEAKTLAADYGNKYPNVFGGMMLWEMTYSENNKDASGKSYARNIRENFNALWGSTTTSTTTTTTTTRSSTTSTKTTTTSSSTTKSSTSSSSTTKSSTTSSSSSTTKSASVSATLTSSSTSTSSSTTKAISISSSTTSSSTTKLSTSSSSTTRSVSAILTSSTSSSSTTLSTTKTSTSSSSTAKATPTTFASTSSSSTKSTTKDGLLTSSTTQPITSTSSTTIDGILISTTTTETSSSASTTKDGLLTSSTTSTSETSSTTKDGLLTSTTTTNDLTSFTLPFPDPSTSSVASTTTVDPSNSWDSWTTTTSKSTTSKWEYWPTTSSSKTPSGDEDPWTPWPTPTNKPEPTSTSSVWNPWPETPDVTVTTITTSYIDICPTGYTTIPFTTTITITRSRKFATTTSDIPSHEDPATKFTWPTNSAGCPSGFFLSTTVCDTGCGGGDSPKTVVLMLPTPAGEVTKTVIPVKAPLETGWVDVDVSSPITAITSATWSAWADSVSASMDQNVWSDVTKIKTASGSTQSWSSTAPAATTGSLVKPFTGGAAAGSAGTPVCRVAVVVVALVVGVFVL